MLYVKLNEKGEAVEVAKNYQTIANEFAYQNKIIPAENIFQEKIDKMGYGLVPMSGMPVKVLGKEIIPDIPIKNEDGTFQRTWKYVDTVENLDDLTKSQMDLVMKARRKGYLEKFADTISPLRWNSWTPEQQEEMSNWYQSVLDMPNDPAWPFIPFPELPSPLK